VTDDARTLATPTLVIHRRGDKAHPVERGRALAALIPGSRYSEHDGDDHAPMIVESQRLVSEVLDFIEQLPEPTPRAARGAHAPLRPSP